MKKYDWTEERDKDLREIYRSSRGKEQLSIRLKRLADEWGWPRHALTLRAQAIGIARDVRKPWTLKEEMFLESWVGNMPVREIARALNRTFLSVSNKIRHNYFRQERDLTADDLREGLGVSWERIKIWRTEGTLVPSRGDWYTAEDLLRFVTTHPEAFDPRTVELPLLRMLLSEAGRRLYRKQSASARRAA